MDENPTETRIPLPERTARRLADLLTAALAAQSVAQAAANETQRIAQQYQQALAAVAEAHDAYGDAVRYDRETGELVATGTRPPTVEDYYGTPQAET